MCITTLILLQDILLILHNELRIVQLNPSYVLPMLMSNMCMIDFSVSSVEYRYHAIPW